MLRLQPCRTQQPRHDQVVADHGRQGNGFDNDHAGRRREATNEGEHRQPFGTVSQRQGQHEGIGIHALPAEMQHATERQGQNEDIDEHQIERKEPDRPLEMRLIDVLDNDDLKLARQENNGQARQQDHCRPRSCPSRIELQQTPQIRIAGGPLEQVAKPAIKSVGDEQSDRQKGNQLDHRLERHRCHHTLVTLGCIEMAGAEQDGEKCQDQRNQKG